MSRVKIVSDGTVVGTKVYKDGEDISRSVQAVSWSMDAAGPQRGPHVVVTLVPTQLEVDVEADVVTADERKARIRRNDEINRAVRKEWDAEFNGIPIDSPDNPTDH